MLGFNYIINIHSVERKDEILRKTESQ